MLCMLRGKVNQKVRLYNQLVYLDVSSGLHARLLVMSVCYSYCSYFTNKKVFLPFLISDGSDIPTSSEALTPFTLIAPSVNSRQNSEALDTVADSIKADFSD